MFFTNTSNGRGFTYGGGNNTKIDDAKGLIAQIVQQVEDRTRKDLQDWVQAQDAAMDPNTPRWHLLQDLYDSLSRDGHFISQWGIRKGAVLCRRFYVKDGKTGQENDAKTDYLKKRWFIELQSDLMEHILKQYSVAQIPEANRILSMHPLEEKYFLLPRRNFIPQFNYFLKDIYGNEAYDILDPAFNNTIICVKSMDKFGLMNNIIPDLIWKRNARQGWAIFSERFGIPLVKIETNRTQKKDIDALELMAKKMGQAARAVIPSGSKMEIVDSATKGDPHKIYLEQINLGNAEISKAILGGTMISDNGSSRSQSEVMERTLDDKITEMDLMNMEFTLNDQVMPILINGKFPFSPGDSIVYDRSENLTLAQLWKIVEGYLKYGYEIDVDWQQEKFQIPIVGKAKKTQLPVKVKEEEEEQDDPENFNKPSGGKKPAALGGVSWPDYTSSGCCPDCGKPKFTANGRDAAFRKVITELQEDILKGIFDNKDVLAERVRKGIAVGGAYRDALFNGWGGRRLEINYDATDHKALAAMEMNLFTFSQLREKASVLELNRLLIDKDGNKLREFSDFKEAAKRHLADMNERWLETEYNFAVAAGQGASGYHRFLSEAQDVTKFLEYLTVGDSKVRDKHRLLHGRKFSIEDPEALRIWPPNDWGCRCEFLQYIGEVSKKTLTTGKEGLQLLDWNDKQMNLFGVNRGDIGQVFLQNQMYIKDAGLANDVKNMTYDKYGLGKWEDIRDDYRSLKLDNSITTGNVSELFKPEEGKDYMGFKDYLNRNLVVKKKVFDEHTQAPRYTTEKENRHKLFPKLQEVLSNPDEVYMYNYRKGVYQYRYVKFYKDSVLIVPAKLGKQNLEVTTWYQLKVKEEAQRSGLLVHIKQKP